MPKLIKDRIIVEDDWQLIRADAAGEIAALPPQDKFIVPLQFWLANREMLLKRGAPIGVWLDSHEEPRDIAQDIGRFPLIAVNFPKFTDGRGYSIGRLLRERYGYKNELRAIGDVLRDQLLYLMRCGFNAFALRADKNIEDAVKAFSDFSEVYQASVEQPIPLFRRRLA